ncbi:MAG: DegT/DnrJ/EryC1/StrS family aminotransferase [Candidatus Levybacteria bacterium]|nr:DegT/DnrJ/EryC1/StrS family aminotransferase [Candidatus Levybacteria bacterium]
MKYKVIQVYPYFTQDEIKEVTESIKDAWVTEGPKSRKFVEKVLEMVGSNYAVLMPNGTLALYVALMALGLKHGDEVIVPDFTFIASANAVYLTGAKPVFVDVKREDLNINPALIEKYITPKTRAIMPVHIYGQCADMDPILEIAKKHKLYIVEDAAQVLGVFYKKKHAGTFGDLGCFSFFADKTITTGGEGGMIVTDNKKLYEKLLSFRNQGRTRSGTFTHPEIGYNFRMTDLQCAVGLAQLKKFKKLKERKLKNDKLYKELLKDIKQVKFIGLSPFSTFIPFRSNIYVENLPKLSEFLEKNGIQTRGMFYPLHKQPCFKMYKYKDDGYPNSIYAFEHGLSLPVHYHLKTNDIKYITDTIKKFYAST